MVYFKTTPWSRCQSQFVYHGIFFNVPSCLGAGKRVRVPHLKQTSSVVFHASKHARALRCEFFFHNINKPHFCCGHECRNAAFMSKHPSDPTMQPPVLEVNRSTNGIAPKCATECHGYEGVRDIRNVKVSVTRWRK